MKKIKMNSKTKILIGTLAIGIILICGLLFLFAEISPGGTTSIELYGCGEPSPRYVNLPISLPVDTEDEARIIANACLKRAIFKDPPAKILEQEDVWYLEGPMRQGLDYPFWSMTINKVTGKTEYAAVK